MSDIRVTYYLGAGASANAVPMVSQIRDYYEPFQAFLKKNIDPKKVQLLLDVEGITMEIKEHSSPDTFAKKLFLKRNSKRVEKVKLYLVLFFYWIETVYRGTDAEIRRGRTIKGGLDKRYDTFLATLLEQVNDNQLKLPPHINIVSWNYDTQIEIAYSAFCVSANYHEIRDGLGIFPKPDYHPPYPENSSKIVKLNSYAHTTYFDKYTGPSNSIDHYKQTALPYILNQFDELLEDSNPNESPSLINFAWEIDNSVSQEALKEAKEIFSKTQILVIIGYSFPTFNRKVDKDLFFHLPPDCTVYYQAPESVVHELIDKLKSIRDITKPVKPVINLDQFHIPIEL